VLLIVACAELECRQCIVEESTFVANSANSKQQTANSRNSRNSRSSDKPTQQNQTEIAKQQTTRNMQNVTRKRQHATTGHANLPATTTELALKKQKKLRN
jgi:hypothetical protein